MRDLYAMPENGEGAPYPISPEDAGLAQKKGHGIFWAVNDFGGQRRKAENLKRLNSFFVEFDAYSKEAQREVIEHTLIPSLVIESARGYHVYWDISECSLEDYKEIQKRIAYHFGGDEKASLVTQLARAPGYYHLKNPSEPFFVTKVFEYEVSYNADTMLYYFDPLPDEEDPQALYVPKAFADQSGEHDLTTKLDCLNNEDALLRLSGSQFVNHERYSFSVVSGGHKNLYVNGKGTSVFIDNEGKIGSTSGGGPTVWQWLKWYGRTNKEVYLIIREVFPELFQGADK